MYLKLIPLALLLSVSTSWANESISTTVLQAMQQCRAISSVFERLSCYDHIETGDKMTALSTSEVKGEAWNRAQTQEKTRETQNLQFILTQTEPPNSRVILTTPALGYPNSRPILMLSCIDNITRLQIALPTSIGKQSNIAVRLNTERHQFSSQWFVREEGFLLEASRGLEGIKEIQQLFHATRLKIQLENNEFNDFVFNIEQLEAEIKPLRAACHW